MRILMLGNSYTFFNDMPLMLRKLTGAEVIAHTRGGARLGEQLNPESNMGAMTQAALRDEHWDYVVIQEYSNGPIVHPKPYFKHVAELSEQAKAADAKPVIYASWAYDKNGKQMKEFSERTGIGYEEMYRGMHEACTKAAEENDALLADVGTVFYEKSPTEDIYHPDGSHPNQAGSMIAAQIIADVIMNDWNNR